MLNFTHNRQLSFLLIGWVAMLMGSCTSKVNSDFVQINEDGFVVNDSSIHLTANNYIVTMQFDGQNIWPCSYQDYNEDKKYSFDEPKASKQEIRDELRYMKELGFNAIRVVHLAENISTNSDSSSLFLDVFDQDAVRVKLPIDSADIQEKFLKGISDFLSIAEEENMKIMLLLRWRLHWPEGEHMLMKIVETCRNSPALLAYDIFNEPLYFDEFERSKQDLIPILEELVHDIRAIDDGHLITIGLEGIREVFEWDPNLLPVDFISFHPYEYEPDQVRNELAWYGKYVDKPWIVGETSIPADNDSVPYSDQLEFARITLDQACSCGAIGYAWWQYKDVQWPKFHPSYMGMMASGGNTITETGSVISGTAKPVAQAFQDYKHDKDHDACLKLANYYNYSQHQTWKVTGRVVDKSRKGVEGAVVLGWNQWWDSSYHTITREDGSFELLTDFPIYHWMASATRYTMVRGDCDPRSFTSDEKSIKGISIGTRIIAKLD